MSWFGIYNLFAWEERYLQVEVDEEGHAGEECEEEDARLEIIAAVLDCSCASILPSPLLQRRPAPQW